MQSNTINEIIRTWNLDAWSIGPQTFKKITDVVPINSTILEFGSGAGTGVLSRFYKMKSIEENPEFMYKYNSEYFYVPTQNVVGKYPEFSEDPVWFNENILEQIVPKIGHYDCILIDGPKGYRGGFYYNRHLFNLENTTLIFDDVHDIHHHKLMSLTAQSINKEFIVYDDINGKKIGIIQK